MHPDPVDKKIENICEELEVCTEDFESVIQESPVLSVPIIMDKMDKVCALMVRQSEVIENKKKECENQHYRMKRAKKDHHHAVNTAYIKYKQEDREKYGSEFKKLGRTDPEYVAMAELDADVKLNESLAAERDYFTALHALEDAQHSYEILENHFLNYRKSCDMLKAEMGNFPRKYGGA